MSIFSSMGLTCTEIPSPTSVPVGHNGGILHREHISSSFTATSGCAGRIFAKCQTAPSAAAPVLAYHFGRITWKIDVSFTRCGMGQPSELFKISDPTSTDMQMPYQQQVWREQAQVQGFRPRLKAYWPC